MAADVEVLAREQGAVNLKRLGRNKISPAYAAGACVVGGGGVNQEGETQMLMRDVVAGPIV